MNDQIILAGPNEASLTRRAVPALTAAGFSVMAIAGTPQKLRDTAAAVVRMAGDGGALALVEADLFPDPDQALAALEALEANLALVLPAAWEEHRDRFMALPNLVAGSPALTCGASVDGPAHWPEVARHLAQRPVRREQADVVPTDVSQPQEPPAATQAPAPAAQREQAQEPTPPAKPQPALPTLPQLPVRLGFYGERGGVGTSAAALAAARALAGEGQRVALFDARRRGDLHLMCGIEPCAEPAVIEGITLFLAEPSEELARGFGAVVIDGGRRRDRFNARWVAVSRPLDENKVRGLCGLEPVEEEDQEQEPKPARRWRPSWPGLDLGKFSGLKNLISVEVTD